MNLHKIGSLRQQVLLTHWSCIIVEADYLHHEDSIGMSKGSETSLLVTIPAQVLYIRGLEITKSNVGNTTLFLGFIFWFRG